MDGLEMLKEVAKAPQELPLLWEEVKSLRAENKGLKEELVELGTLVTSLHSSLSSLEAKVSTVSTPLDLLQSDPEHLPQSLRKDGRLNVQSCS